MRIKYLISTHKNYYETTVDKLVTSLLNSGIDKSDIIVVIGGMISCISPVRTKEDVNYCSVESNSFDLTALITVCKKNLFTDYDYFFLLHDTCEVGRNFKNKLESFIKPELNTIAMFGAHPASNIGLYKRKYLMENIEKLLSLEDKDKSFYVQHEDSLLVDKFTNYFSHNVRIDGYKNVYSDSTVREVNICDEIELYKYKANWYVRDWVIAP